MLYVLVLCKFIVQVIVVKYIVQEFLIFKNFFKKIQIIFSDGYSVAKSSFSDGKLTRQMCTKQLLATDFLSPINIGDGKLYSDGFSVTIYPSPKVYFGDGKSVAKK